MNLSLSGNLLSVSALVISLAALGQQPSEEDLVDASLGDLISEQSVMKERSKLSDGELQIWNDPDFKRRFAESYLSETEVEPRVTIEEREDMEKALELIAANEMERALVVLEKGRSGGASAVFDFTIANIHFQREEFEAAAAAYEVAVQKFPKFLRAWKNLGLIHVRRNEFAEAAKKLGRSIELGATDSLTYGLLGFSYGSLEQHLAAETAYRQATMLDPATEDWKMGLARSLFKQKRYADAASLTGSMIAADETRVDLWLLQANAFIGLEQPMRAAENFEIVDRLGGSTKESLNGLGDIYVNEELHDLAVDRYLAALRTDEEAAPDRALRAARVLTAQGALEPTKKLVAGIDELRGDALDETNRKTLLKLRARIAVSEGAGDEEARILEEIVEIDPLDGEALILLGQHAGRSGDVEKAAFWYERAASLADHEADAKVRHAQLLVSEQRYLEALPMLRRAQSIKPRENIQQFLERVEKAAGTR